MVRIFDMTGNQSPTSTSRTVEKVLDDSQYTGEINLSGRKLKEYPLSASKYDLIDTTLVDLSRNRFSDIPHQVCDYHSVEHLSCYHNVIKSIPPTITRLQNLVHLNLSRNQLTVLPPFLCNLEQLQVLLVNNNRLVSLPEEIGRLQQLMELDVGSNEITHLPSQLGELASLRSLNLRRNRLVELPIGLCRLRLCCLDFSCNRVAHIPCDFHRMDSLEQLCLDNNPLLSPPAHACTKGLVHIRKFLSMEALRDERKRGVMQNDVNLRSNLMNTKRFPSSLSAANSDEMNVQSDLCGEFDRLRIGMVDSGYSTTDSVKKSHGSNSEKADYDQKRKRVELQQKAEEMEREDQRRKGGTAVPPQDEQLFMERYVPRENGNFVGYTQGLPSQSQSFRDFQKVSSPAVVVPLRRLVSDADYNQSNTASELWTTNDVNTASCTTPNSATYEPKVAPTSWCPDRAGSIPITVHHLMSSSASSASDGGYQVPMDDELRRRHEAVVAQHRREALNVRQRLEEEKMRMRQMYSDSDNMRNSPSFVRQDDDRSSLSSGDPAPNSFSETSSNSSSSKIILPVACQRALDAMSSDLNSMNPVFTIRRNLQHVQEEREQIEQLRRIIEALLKVKLPDDLPGALRDGVVLCHLANHVRPRSVATIHVPSPAVPSLSLTKCRRNVENFLLACRRLGIDQEFLCSCDDIIEELRPGRITKIVQHLVSYQPTPLRDRAISVFCLLFFCVTCLLLYLFPLPS